MGSCRVGIILKGYPRLSETFIAEELHGLEQEGLELCLFSMRHPTDHTVHPVHREISAPVTYLPEYLHNEPVRVLRGLVKAMARPGFVAAVKTWLRDLAGDMTRNRFRRFGQAAVLAAEMPDDISHLHAHFIHTPASVTRYASLLTGRPWTCSAHAKDIWTSQDHDLRDKISSAEWVVTCTKFGLERLKSLAADDRKLHLSYHGLDLTRFATYSAPRPLRDGTQPDSPVRLLTVCRAVEKKGLDTLIAALADLPAECQWQWTHIGTGELIPRLQEQARRLKIDSRVTWLGAMAQSDVLQQYRDNDLFVLPCRIANDGDRDGLPNVIVEAQSQGLCCLSTPISGVPELITDGHNGILVPSDDKTALARALQSAIADPQRRIAMGQHGETLVRSDFSKHASVAYLKQLFDQVLLPVKSLS